MTGKSMLVATLHTNTYTLCQIKKTIIPTINSLLDEIWHDDWSKLKGHHQTKYWLTLPDPYLASKLLNLSREYLGKCIQFFTGHGWWNKHLKITNLNDFTLLSPQYTYLKNVLQW